MTDMDITPEVKKKTRARGAHVGALQTPGSDILTPNDDTNERLDMRRHSTAKAFRKSMGGGGMPPGGPEPRREGASNTGGKKMSSAELSAMYEHVIKMAAENKITKNNVWDLDIIYHMPSIIREYSSANQQFNFQRASCGLDAGVNIYSKRVDSVHETVLGALFGCKGTNRDAGPDDEDRGPDDQHADQGGDGTADDKAEGGGKAGKRRRACMDASNTLADATSLRAKDVETTFDSDPLFGKTSKLFDENSAAGLLLLNLGVYGGCEILFDSAQVPSLQFLGAPAAEGLGRREDQQVDLSCLPGLQQILAVASGPTYGITPSIEQLYSQLGPGGSWGDGALPDTEAILGAAMMEEEAFFGPVRQRAPARASNGHGQGDADGVDGSHDGCGGSDDMAQSPAPGTSSRPADWGGGDSGAEAAGPGQYEQPDDVFVDDDGFACGPGADDDGGDEDGSGMPGGGGAGSEEEGGEEEGAEVPSDLSQWLTRQPASLQAAQQQAGAGGRDRGGSAAWAGAGFWRFNGAAARSKQAKEAVANAAAGIKAKEVAKGKKAPGAALQLDTDDEDPEFEARRAAKAKPGETQLCKRSRAKTLLPEDLHLDPRRLLFRALRTAHGEHDVLSIWRSHAQASAAEAAARGAKATAGAAGQSWDEADGGYNGGGGDGGYGGEDGQDDYGGGFGEDGGDSAGEDAAAQAMMQATAAAAAAAGMLGPDGLQCGDMPTLLAIPRKVQRIDVSYDRVAKVVDVRLLKEVIHKNITERLSPDTDRGAQQPLHFQDLILGLSEGGGEGSSHQAAAPAGQKPTQSQAAPGASSGAAAPFRDLSVHLCFICLLHLANEHGLELSTHGQLDRLSVSGGSK